MNRALTGHSLWRARRLTRRLPRCNEALLLILFRVALARQRPAEGLMIFGALVSYRALCLEKRPTAGEHAMNHAVLYDIDGFARPCASEYLLRSSLSSSLSLSSRKNYRTPSLVPMVLVVP